MLISSCVIIGRINLKQFSCFRLSFNSTILTKIFSISAIIVSGIFSLIIATASIDYGAMELGALIYFIIPIIVLIGTIILFLVIDIFLKEIRNALTITFICINLLAGLLMRLDFYYHILNI